MKTLIRLIRLIRTRLLTYRLTGKFRIPPSPLPSADEIEAILTKLRQHKSNH